MVREKALKKTPMESREETYQAIRDTLALLGDPFTRHLEPTRLAAIRANTRASVVGVGLEIAFDGDGSGGTGDVVVIAPQQGGPADEAGVVPGTRVVAVGGTPVRGMNLYDVADLLKGEEGSEVVVSLVAPGAKNPSDVTLPRRRVQIQALTYTTCPGSGAEALGGPEGKVGYLRIQSFTTATPIETREALLAFQKAGVKKIVLDLRNNAGGKSLDKSHRQRPRT